MNLLSDSSSSCACEIRETVEYVVLYLRMACALAV